MTLPFLSFSMSLSSPHATSVIAPKGEISGMNAAAACEKTHFQAKVAKVVTVLQKAIYSCITPRPYWKKGRRCVYCSTQLELCCTFILLSSCGRKRDRSSSNQLFLSLQMSSGKSKVVGEENNFFHSRVRGRNEGSDSCTQKHPGSRELHTSSI